jgi:isoquinoline 1-oxidoreductase alpha subunit
MIALTVNGESRQFDGDPNMPLLWYLRDELHLMGTKYGCGAGLCGACTIHLEGEAVRACMASVGDAEGKQVITIEGLSPDGNHPVQIAWREINVPQCGFCQTGQIMQAAGLLAQKQTPSDQEILDAMAGNVCRCGCYERIVAAVRQAATGA